MHDQSFESAAALRQHYDRIQVKFASYRSPVPTAQVRRFRPSLTRIELYVDPSFIPRFLPVRGKSRPPVIRRVALKTRAGIILAQVAAKYGMEVSDLTGNSRIFKVARSRHEAAYRLRREVMILGSPMSFPQIGIVLGGRDHSTIIRGIQRHEQVLARQRKAI
jgi:hypothetical protein